jgi:GMP reductase
MEIETDLKLDYKDVLLKPRKSDLESRSQVTLATNYTFKHSKQTYSGIPIVAANMDGVGTFSMAERISPHHLFTCLTKTHSKRDLIDWIETKGKSINNFWAYSLGITQNDLDKLDTVMAHVSEDAIKYICIDIANGYIEKFKNVIRTIRNKYPRLTIIAGNVVTSQEVKELIWAGADIAKIGIGSGSACSTRIKTGVGYPQLAAIFECAEAAARVGGHIMADGGCTCPGDVAKAFAAGAHFVMLGGMLAGHDEGGGEIYTKWYKTNEVRKLQTFDGTKHIAEWEPVYEQKKFVQFYGMSSKVANEKHSGGLKDYRAAEGHELAIPYKGSVNDTVQELLGGLRSACTYVGASSLGELHENAVFIRVTQQHNTVFL